MDATKIKSIHESGVEESKKPSRTEIVGEFYRWSGGRSFT